MSRLQALGAILFLSACASSVPSDVPQAIAASWCERNRPGDEACLSQANAAHRRCMTEPGSYDACRASFKETQTAAQ
jgi:hypothetical protein